MLCDHLWSGGAGRQAGSPVGWRERGGRGEAAAAALWTFVEETSDSYFGKLGSTPFLKPIVGCLDVSLID